MATFVLVHGGWCASWCWDFNVQALNDAGHRTICVDLPGHGSNDSMSLESVGLEDHVRCVEEVLEELDEPANLVAHSMSGMIIAQVAENMPEKVEKAVFFAAFLPENDGTVMMDYLQEDPWSLVGPKTTVYMENGLCTFNMDYARNMRFNTSNDETFFYAAPKMQLENPTMWSQPVHLSEKFEQVKKVYIHTLKDNCCSYYLQRVMVKRQPCIAEYYLDTDHVGMLSDPQNTNKILLAIAAMQ